MFTHKPNIRTVTISVKKEAPKPPPAPRHPSSTTTSSAHPSSSLRLQPKKSNAALKVRKASSSSTRTRDSTPKAKTPAQNQSLAVQNASRKRKDITPQFASSSESESEDGEGARKRHKTSSSIEPESRRTLEPDFRRRVRFLAKEGDGEGEGEEVAEMIHGVDMTSGEKEMGEFKATFTKVGENGEVVGERIVVELQYPSSSIPEKFSALTARDDSNWDPIKDIEYTVEEIISHYLPAPQSALLSDETSGPVRLLKRAVAKNDPAAYRKALTDFNATVRAALADGSIPRTLDAMHAVPPSLVRRVLAQVYQRTVSPNAHLLKKVKDKATTYGELLPPFVNKVFYQTRLSSSSVFVDLGSGVGNVVLQAALQTGAESWGIEIMSTPCAFAEAQAKELRARARLWNLDLGPIHLLSGDFLASPEIDAVLRRADVVLVNNKVFPQQLNGLLLDKFLDLKEGAKVVSLESFTPGGRQGARNEQNVASLFREERGESGTQSVSWAGESVEYYIATKEERRG